MKQLVLIKFRQPRLPGKVGMAGLTPSFMMSRCWAPVVLILTCVFVQESRGDLFYGVKVYGTGQIPSQPPAHLFRFTTGDTSVTDLGAITRETQIDVDGLAFSAAQGLFGYERTGSGSILIRIDPLTAEASAIGSELTARDIRGAAFDHLDRLWVLDSNADQLLQIDHTNGAVIGSPVAIDIDVSSTADIAVDNQGSFMLVDNQAFSALNPSTGQTTLLHTDNEISADGFQLANVGLAFERSGQAIFTFDIREQDDIFRYEPDSGFARDLTYGDILNTFNSGRGDLASSVAPIPEPGSFLSLAMMGGAALLLRRRHRCRRWNQTCAPAR